MTTRAPAIHISSGDIIAGGPTGSKPQRYSHSGVGHGARHSFAAFVDDSTVFLEHANHVPRVMELVREFGRMSGLQAQPTKSHLIFLNTAVQEETYCGLPMLAHGDTVRYLGYAVGTGPLQDVIGPAAFAASNATSRQRHSSQQASQIV